MAKKLYVGNLSYDTTEQDLRDLFAEFGTVTSVALIKDRETGSSKGFAFVEMDTQEAADQARQKLNNSMFQNRALKIDEARPPSSDRSGGGSRSYSGGGSSGGYRSGGGGGSGFGGGGGWSGGGGGDYGGGGYGKGDYGKGGGKKKGKKQRGGGRGSSDDYGGW